MAKVGRQVMNRPPIGVQMWTLNTLAATDLFGALERVAAIGYRGVELFGLHGHAPVKVREMADGLGIALSSALVRYRTGTAPRPLLDEMAALGVPTMSCGLFPDEFESFRSVIDGVARLNQAAAIAAEYGIELAYHNHTAEFTRSFNGKSWYDVLWEHLDPRVIAEIDIYWTKLGGADPARVVSSLGERVRYLHVKDGPAVDPQAPMVAVGSGSLDVTQILSAAPHARWHLVEFDRCSSDVFEVLQQSYNFLVGSGLSDGRLAPLT
jgi:sugar phosphate isomerase/epimerase